MSTEQYILSHKRFGIRRFIRLDYSRPEHYRVVLLPGNASAYRDRELAERAVRFLGGETQGFEIYQAVMVPEGMVIRG